MTYPRQIVLSESFCITERTMSTHDSSNTIIRRNWPVPTLTFPRHDLLSILNEAIRIAEECEDRSSFQVTNMESILQ
jgi:hypothetical protein